MLKRRPSKRFVLAETGEESAWNTTTDNDPDKPSHSTALNPVPPPPQIEVGLIGSANSSKNEDITDSPPETMVKQLLAVPQPNLKSGMK